ncbi:hypothetical protein HNR76_003051 [Pseudoxanthomonas broegbernensis]|nr:hypothetical protein [Pseudoxanthomonas broegbernensis]
MVALGYGLKINVRLLNVWSVLSILFYWLDTLSVSVWVDYL